MRGQYARVVTPELVERVHKHILENREKYRLWKRSLLKINSRRIQKKLGLKARAVYYLFNYMELEGMLKIVAIRKTHNGTIYFVELLEQVPVSAGPSGKSH